MYKNMEQKIQAIQSEVGLPRGSTPLTEEIMPGVRPIWAQQLKQKDIPPLDWLVDQLISDAGINAISAKPGLFKTFLAMEIAKCVANGDSVFGVFPTRQTKVLIIDQESGERRLKQRQALLEADDANMAYVCYANQMMSTEFARDIISFCKANAIGLVIFDSLTRFHEAKESSNDEMAKVLADFQLIPQAGISVVIIHHDAKSGYEQPNSSNTLRGASDILANCDVHLSVSKAKNSSNKIVVKQLKNRDAEEVPSFELMVNSSECRLRFEYVGAAPKQVGKQQRTNEAIIELITARGEMFQKQIIEALQPIPDLGGEAKIIECLDSLTPSRLTTRVGAHGRRYYSIKPEQTNE